MVSLAFFSRKKLKLPPLSQNARKTLQMTAHTSLSLSDLVLVHSTPSTNLAANLAAGHSSSTSNTTTNTTPPASRSGKTAAAPPRIRTDHPLALALALAPALPVSRRLDLRQLPASYVRHLRVLSTHSAPWAEPQLARRRLPLQDVPPELRPVVHLLNAQRLRQYAEGHMWVSFNDITWDSCDAVLTGTELCLWADGASTARYLNVQDCMVQPGRTSTELVVLQDFDANMTTLRFSDAHTVVTWLAALQLAKFENTSNQEAFTAVVLLLKGPDLLDIYTLLAHKKRFPRFEWCNLRLPQVLSKWVRVYVAIMPGDAKKKGRMEVYTLDKISKKSLVLYVNDAAAVYNVYPEDPHMILFNLIMKLEGEVFVNKLFEHLFAHEPAAPAPSRIRLRSSQTSLNSHGPLSPPPVIGAPHAGTRLRSTSINSATLFFVNAPLPAPERIASPSSPGTPPRPLSQNFFKKQSANNFVLTTYLYLMPLTHPGVSAIEIMIRNFVHIIDAFKLYGRPDHLNSNKRDPVSMLFGMPLLPHCFYLSTDEAYDVVAANFDTARVNNWGDLEWRNCLKEYLLCKQADSEYTGTGNIAELFESVELECESLALPQYGLRVTSPAPLAPSRLRESTSDNGIHNLYNDSDLPISGPPLNDAGYLGKSLDYDTLRPSMGMDVVRSLEPIVDLPTPMDNITRKSYFAGNDETVAGAAA